VSEANEVSETTKVQIRAVPKIEDFYGHANLRFAYVPFHRNPLSRESEIHANRRKSPISERPVSSLEVRRDS